LSGAGGRATIGAMSAVRSLLGPALAAAAGLLLGLLAAPSVAAPSPASTDEARLVRQDRQRQQNQQAGQSGQTEILTAFEARDYATAERLLRAALEADPGNPMHLYNLACLHSLRREAEPALERLKEAISAGFRNWAHLAEDPDLAFLRSLPEYAQVQRLVEGLVRDGVGGANAAEASLRNWIGRFGERHYRVERDPQRNLIIVTSLDEASHREMIETIDRQADHLVRTLFDEYPRHPALLVVPRPEDAERFFGSGSTAGLYEHERRRLITRDIGESLRHELVHLLHHAQMERTGQRHPIWVQEGLATLYEAYTLRADGGVEFRPNSRHNVAFRASRAGVVRPWREVLAATPEQFMRQGPRLYPQVRSMWEFFAEEIGLPRFWRLYLDTYPQSPDGTLAIETAFGAPIEQIERRWRRWVVARGPIDDAVRPGDAWLGVEGEDRPDGVLVRRVAQRSAAALAGVRRGDLLVEIDGEEIRSDRELILAIAGRSPGEQVEVVVRRRGERVPLVAVLQPMPRSAGGSAIAPGR